MERTAFKNFKISKIFLDSINMNSYVYTHHENIDITHTPHIITIILSRVTNEKYQTPASKNVHSLIAVLQEDNMVAHTITLTAQQLYIKPTEE